MFLVLDVLACFSCFQPLKGKHWSDFWWVRFLSTAQRKALLDWVGHSLSRGALSGVPVLPLEASAPGARERLVLAAAFPGEGGKECRGSKLVSE